MMLMTSWAAWGERVSAGFPAYYNVIMIVVPRKAANFHFKVP